MALNGWTDADPSVNSILAANQAAWTRSDEEEQILDGTCFLPKNAINAAWTIEYLGNVDPTAGSVWSRLGNYVGTPTNYESVTDTDASNGVAFHLRTNNEEKSWYYRKSWSSSSATGYTIEARLKLVTGNSFGVYLSWEATSKWDSLMFEDSGSDIVITFQHSGETTTLTGYNNNEFHTYRITVTGTAITVYVDGISELTGTMTQTTANSRIQWGDADNAPKGEAYWDYVRWYEGGVVAPAYSTTQLTAQSPALDTADITTDIVNWGELSVATSGVFNNGTTEVYTEYANTTTSSTWTSGVAYTTISSDNQTIDLTGIQFDDDESDKIRFTVRQVSDNGTASPAGIDALTVDFVTDVTPPEIPDKVIKYRLKDGSSQFLSTMSLRIPTDGDYSHCEVGWASGVAASSPTHIIDDDGDDTTSSVLTGDSVGPVEIGGSDVPTLQGESDRYTCWGFPSQEDDDKALFTRSVDNVDNASSWVKATSGVTASDADNLVITQQPSATVSQISISPAITIEARDVSNVLFSSYIGTVTSYIGTTSGGETLGGTTSQSAVSGVATFNDLSVDKVGTYTLVFSASGVARDISDSFNITAGTASQLVVTQQPSGVIATSGISPSLTVEARDAFGNINTSFTSNIVAAINDNPPNGTLGGTTTQAAVSGVATFDDLNINKSSNGYSLEFTSSGLSDINSNKFNVTPAEATKIVITQDPINAATAATLSPIIAQAQDTNSNIDTNFSSNITIALNNNPGSSTLSGTKTVSATSGSVTFSDLSLDNSGDGYTLDTTSGALTSDTTTTFNITAGVSGTDPDNTVMGIITEGNASLQVAFTTPAGKTTDGYLYDFVANSVTAASGISTPYTFPGLTNGQQYGITVQSRDSSTNRKSIISPMRFGVPATASAVYQELFRITETTKDTDGADLGLIKVGNDPVGDGYLQAFAQNDTALTTPLFEADIQSDGSFILDVDAVGQPTYKLLVVKSSSYQGFSTRTIQASGVGITLKGALQYGTAVNESTLNTSSVALGKIVIGGIPRCGKVIVFNTSDTNFTTPIAYTTIHDDGGFEVRLPAGNYTLKIVADGITGTVTQDIIVT